MKRAFIFLLAFLPLQACAQGWLSGVELSTDMKRLTLKTTYGTEPAPTIEDQTGFTSAKISMDGQYAGWLALFPNCCTSYPVSLTLVVIGPDRALHRFEGTQAIFGWCFNERARAVVFRRGALHGAAPEQYEMRRIRGGQLLRAYQAPAQEVPKKAPLPAWAQCASGQNTVPNG